MKPTMKTNLLSILYGSSGIAGVEAVTQAAATDPATITEMGGLIIQIIIGIITLFGLFKKKK